MGVIRKKIANRGGEGGVKYVCDVCSADITSTVSQLRLLFFCRGLFYPRDPARPAISSWLAVAACGVPSTSPPPSPT